MVKIKTITDVVTNSSSETFIIKNPGISKEKLIEILKDCHEKYISEGSDDKFGSGMGGIFEVKTFQDMYLEAKNDYPKTTFIYPRNVFTIPTISRRNT